MPYEYFWIGKIFPPAPGKPAPARPARSVNTSHRPPGPHGSPGRRPGPRIWDRWIRIQSGTVWLGHLVTWSPGHRLPGHGAGAGQGTRHCMDTAWPGAGDPAAGIHLHPGPYCKCESFLLAFYLCRPRSCNPVDLATLQAINTKWHANPLGTG